MLLKNFKEFHWLKDVLPKHIPHSRSEIAALKSKVASSEMIFESEASYVDCVKILDGVETEACGYFMKAHGTF